jgi:O-antigen ligase
MFIDNPAAGVGPGVGPYVRASYGGFRAASHTEYTRMLGEHGILGLLSLACLLYVAVRAFRATRARQIRGVCCAMLMWAGLFLAVYSTRLAAPAIVLGIACGLRSPAPQPRTAGAPTPSVEA